MEHYDMIYSSNDNYKFQGITYSKYFPLDWSTSHLDGTGPHECDNCFIYGSINEMFIGYCMNCARHDYDCKRGHGFYDGYEDIISEDFENSATHTYLKYFNMSDEDINNEEARLEILRNEEQIFQDYIDAYHEAVQNISK
jgi:hypothetical protein